MYMALHITNPAVEQKVRDLASLTGESMTDAIGAAVEERMLRVKPPLSKQADPTIEEILELVRSFKLQPINEGLTEDEILGYGPHGFSE
ncbi:MAG: type II toxin-antitoxin system VapB family antitoxin [Acidobacteriaceae bacterium]